MHYHTGNTPPSHRTYDDLEGNVKQFTYVDHDKKPTFAVGINEPVEESHNKVKAWKELRIKQLLLLSAAVIARIPNADRYQEFVTRDPEKGVLWNETVIRNYCDVVGMYECYLLFMLTWKAAMKVEYWFEDLTLEEMEQGKHLEWIASVRQF